MAGSARTDHAGAIATTERKSTATANMADALITSVALERMTIECLRLAQAAAAVAALEIVNDG
jgi:hypothetical protein